MVFSGFLVRGGWKGIVRVRKWFLIIKRLCTFYRWYEDFEMARKAVFFHLNGSVGTCIFVLEKKLTSAPTGEWNKAVIIKWFEIYASLDRNVVFETDNIG